MGLLDRVQRGSPIRTANAVRRVPDRVAGQGIKGWLEVGKVQRAWKQVALSGVCAAALASPAWAAGTGIPVNDAENSVISAKQLVEDLNMVRQGAQVVANTAESLRLENIAGLAFGNAGSGFGAVMDAGQSAYSASNQAYQSVLGVQSQFGSALYCLNPPVGGYAAMGIQESITKLQCAQRLTNGTNQAALRSAADRLEQMAGIRAKDEAAQAFSGSSVSPIQAMQAQSMQLRSLAARMDQQNQALTDLVQIEASKELREQQEREAVDGLRDADKAARALTLSGGPATPQKSPLDWGS